MALRQIIRKIYRKIVYRKYKNITDSSSLDRNIKVFNRKKSIKWSHQITSA